MTTKRIIPALLILAAALALSGCGATPAPAEPTPGGIRTGIATVESIDIRLLESFPVQVHVAATGYLSDACTTIDKVTQTRQGQAFTVTITTARPADRACAEMIVPFEQVVPLDVAGLPAGTYTVSVNGVSGSFTLQQDNALK